MNKMTEYQCKLVEENLDIIDSTRSVAKHYAERLWPITRKEGPFLRWAADMSIMRSLITAGSKICFSSIMPI